MLEKITSVSNPRVKFVVQLRDRKTRDESNLTIIEGAREIARAIEVKVSFKECFICSDYLEDDENKVIVEKLLSLNVQVNQVPKNVFTKMAYGDLRDGILTTAKPKIVKLDKLQSKQKALYVIVEGVEKPGNLGAILRSADAAGVDGVIATNLSTDLFNPNVIRASLGTIFTVPVAVGSNEEVLSFLDERKVSTYATSPEGRQVYHKINYRKSIAFILGSEHKGLNNFWQEHATETISIPMHGMADSLNVSATTAILLYETIRQRS